LSSISSGDFSRRNWTRLCTIHVKLSKYTARVGLLLCSQMRIWILGPKFGPGLEVISLPRPCMYISISDLSQRLVTGYPFAGAIQSLIFYLPQETQVCFFRFWRSTKVCMGLHIFPPSRDDRRQVRNFPWLRVAHSSLQAYYISGKLSSNTVGSVGYCNKLEVDQSDGCLEPEVPALEPPYRGVAV
jgi:hypothetical protein